MYTIDEYRTPAPTYHIDRDTRIEYRREDLLREIEADAATGAGKRRAYRFRGLRAAWSLFSFAIRKLAMMEPHAAESFSVLKSRS